jgi:RHS repeat-associated protein
MTTSTSVHSNALNFMSCLNSGVDPRTGLYNVSINLPDLLGNDLRGPGLALGMAYSPLNTQDGGYGLGWSLQLSQYDIGSKILSLSTGETYKVTDDNGIQLKMEEQKLDSFRFYRQDDRHFRVVHKSGMVEILEIRGSIENRVALPVQIYAASGHRLDLDYQAFSSTRQILRSVTDELGQTLMSLKREGYSIEVLLHPFSGPEGGPLARFVMSLSTSDYRVSRITLPTENEASWRFTYDFEQDNQLCIKEVHTPTGAREEIWYLDTGHEFPDSSGLMPLPRVTRHIIYPGLEQPAVDVRYTYGNNQNRRYNFLGAGLSITWDNDGLDNLYKHYTSDYDYVCTESLWVGGVDGEVVRSIERTFNRLHLQTLEVTTQNNNVQTVETTYNIESGKPYKDQPSDCQMPREIKTTWREEGTNRIRSETVSNTYDRHGNPLTHTRADGIVETSTWYPAEGGDGCPEDPEGFVRQLKDKTTSPAPSAQGGAPTLCTRYRYSALPALEQSPLSQWLVPLSETLVQLDAESGESQLQQIRMEYFDLPDQPLLHGHVQRRTSTLNGQSTISTYDYATLLSPQLGVQVLEATETLSTDFDNVSSTVLRQKSLFNGQDLLIEAQGVKTRYEYDALNRLVRETVAPDTEFVASRQYQYLLCANAGETAEQVLINARNVTTRTVVDGLGRAVFEESDHVDEASPGRFRQTYAARYNSWNNLQEETVHDWLEGQELALSSHYAYDDWGQRCCVTDASGVESHQDLDPIGTFESGPILRTWLQNTGESPTVSGRSEAWLNLFGKTDRVMSLTADNAVLGTQTYLYDGLGRCTEQSDELRHITTFSYDAWSRLVSSTLPDRSVVSRDYALHSSAELPTALNVLFSDGVTRILAGEQEFDGLQRLTRVKVGPRSEGYAYDGDRSQVKSRTTAAGDTLEFDYNLLLTDQPVASRAPDESAEFNYDRTSARLTRASNEQGVRTYDYDSLNRLRSESWRDKQGEVWQTLYVNSLQGRALKRTDFQQDAAPGQDTLYRYDLQGRLHILEQGRIQVTLDYNELSQVSSITTLDQAARTTLLTELEYDDQGREILRTLTAGAQPARTLEQVWQIDGLLESRHLQQGGETLLKEVFHYDPRGRLTRHECSEDSSTLPRDALGRQIVRQIFTFDALDNLKNSLATFVDKTTERAQFNYAADDPCQLAGITYTPPRATPDPNFTYDDNGNQEHDERGQKLTYDSQSRLLSVGPVGQEVSAYRYDSHDHLVTSRSGSASEILRFYQEHQLSGSVQDGRQTQYLYLGDQPLGQQQTDDPNQTLLLLTDANNSVLGESQQNDLRTAVYNAYGERHSDEELLSQLAFNGEVRDPDNGWYLLGNGYRAYNPSLMRFHSPDSLSPFGAGGLNPYTYCLGNPIALRDPTGHQAAGLSGRPRRYPENPLPAETGGGGGFMDWVWVAVGVVTTGFTAALTVASFGAATPALGASVTFLGITTTAATASTVATAALATGTVLGAAATGAEAYGVATGDETSRKIAMGLGIASLPFDIFGGFLKSAVKGAVKGALAATELAATAKASAAVIEDGSGLVPNRFKNPFGNGKMNAGTQTSFDTPSVATQTRKIRQTKVKAAKPVNKTKSSRRVASATSNESATTGTSMAPTSNAGRWPAVQTTGLARRAEPNTGDFWTRAVAFGDWKDQIKYSARS